MNDFSPDESREIAVRSEKLNFTTKLAYGAGDFGPAIAASILAFFLLYFFTNVAGLPAGLSGIILAVGKIFDAINDPITGVLSDRTRSPWGRRIPWMFWGAIPFGILLYLQWIVPHFNENQNTNAWLLFIYYVAIGILFNLAYTVVNLPYTALTPELTQDYNERTNLNSFRFAFSIGGSILSLILAQLIFVAYPKDRFEQYSVLGFLCSVLSVITIFWCSLRIQERGATPILNDRQKHIFGFFLTTIGVLGCFYGVGIGRFISQATSWTSEQVNVISISAIAIGFIIIMFGITLILSKTESHLQIAFSSSPQTNTETNLNFLEQLKIVFSNKPFLYVIGLYLCSWLGLQLTTSILIYFVVSWIGMSEGDFPKVAIAVQGTALIVLFFWQYVSKKLGKKAVYSIGMGIWIIAQIGLFLLQPGQIGFTYCLAVLAGFGVSVAYLIPWSMIPDVIELDELNTGQRREGIFYGFMVLLQKFGLALAIFLVGSALELAGFIEQPPGGEVLVQPESALLAIRIAIAPLPAFFLIAGVILAYFYPITREVHAEIRLKLQERYRDSRTNS
jgi:glycoside/pentoside/hexuronide:cation symporter, GPH family